MVKDVKALRARAMAAAFNDGHDVHQYGPSPLTWHPEAEKAIRAAIERALDVVLTEKTHPPMWGLWLNDPSGKYGPDKPFFEHGWSAEEAYVSALATYAVDGVTIDESRDPFILNPAK